MVRITHWNIYCMKSDTLNFHELWQTIRLSCQGWVSKTLSTTVICRICHFKIRNVYVMYVISLKLTGYFYRLRTISRQKSIYVHGIEKIQSPSRNWLQCKQDTYNTFVSIFMDIHSSYSLLGHANHVLHRDVSKFSRSASTLNFAKKQIIFKN